MTIRASVQGTNAQLAEAAASIPSGARMLVLHADLPLLQVADLHALAAVSQVMAVCPDRNRRGTNALLQPNEWAEFHFGSNSFDDHCQAAIRKGIEARILHRPGLAWDLDTPADRDKYWPVYERRFAPVLAQTDG